MKKTLTKTKLQLSRTTLRLLSSPDLGAARGGMQNQPTHGCPVFTQVSCSCHHSVCNSCYDTDCCLMVP